MADPYGNSPSKYHLLFGCKPSNSDNITVLTSIKSIWDDDHIEKLEDNQWKCLWCDVTFQGVNAKKALIWTFSKRQPVVTVIYFHGDVFIPLIFVTFG